MTLDPSLSLIEVASVLVPKGASPLPIARDMHFEGGYRAVSNVVARDAITTERRTHGMLVRTNSDGKIWALGVGLTNADWTEFVAGGSGEANSGPGPDVTIHVDLTGDDALGDGSGGAPYLTFARAMRDIPGTLERRIFVVAGPGSFPSETIERRINYVGTGSLTFRGTPLTDVPAVAASAAVPDPTDCLVNVNIGAFATPFTQGDLFLIASLFGRQFFFPVVALSSPLVTIVAPSFWTALLPGATVNLRQIDSELDGFVLTLPGLAIEQMKIRHDGGGAFTFVSGDPVRPMLADGVSIEGVVGSSGFQASFFSLAGVHVNADPTFQDFVVDMEASNIDKAQFWSAVRARLIGGGPQGGFVDTQFSDIRHVAAIGAADDKLRLDFGLSATNGIIKSIGAGVILRVTNFARSTLQNAFTIGAGVTKMLRIDNGSFVTRSAGGASGTVSGPVVDVRDRSTLNGVSGYSAAVSTPAGEDIIVGANTPAFSFAGIGVAKTDISLGDSSELCRVMQ